MAYGLTSLFTDIFIIEENAVPEEQTQTEQPVEKPENPDAKKGMLKKLLIFGLPAFLIQLVLIYFLTAKFIVPLTTQERTVGSTGHSGKDSSGKEEETKIGDEGKDAVESKELFIYTVKDMIINPAGTNGQRYLLTTIAFNLSSDEAMKALEKKEMAVRDMLNSILTGKTMEELTDVSKREALRQEIATKTKVMVDHGRLVSVYFSKYIVQ